MNDELVEKALLQLVLGFDYEETNEKTVIENGRIVIHEVRKQKKYMPPDFRAIQFWLINRKPEEWKIGQPSSDEDNNALERLDTMLEEVRKIAYEAC